MKAALALSLLSGCGTKFSAQKQEDPLKAQSISGNGSPLGGGTPGTPGVIDTPIGPVNTNNPVGIINDLTKIGMNINIPYGILGKPLGLVLNDALNQYVRTKDCDKVGTAEDTRPANRQYRCGEIPFGDLVDAGKKFIYKLDIQSTWGSQDGTNFWFGGSNTQIYMDRAQRLGSISIDLLDEHSGTQNVGTSNLLAQDLFLRLEPKDGTLNAGVCFTIPGTTINSGPLWFPGHINKTVMWVVDIDADLSVNVNLGSAQFDSVKSCVSVQATYDQKTGTPQIKITSIERPQFQNLNLNGFYAHTDTTVHGFWGVVIDIVDFFGGGIKQTISNAVTSQVQAQFNNEAQVTTQQVTSGEWLLEVLHYDYLKPLLVDNVNSALNVNQNNAGKKFEIEVGKWLSAACLTLVDRYAVNQQVLTQNQLYSVCKGVPDIQLNAFLDDDSMSAKGCYSRFFSIQTLINDPSKWWNSQCSIKNQVIVTAPKSIAPIFQCLADAVNSNFTNIEQCRPYLDQLVALIKSGQLDSYLNNSAIVDAYMSDAGSAFATIQDLAKQYLGYDFKFVFDPSILATAAQILGITPSMTLDTITSAGTKNISVMNVDMANAQNLLQALVARKKAGTAPDIILLQNANTDAARKFIKDVDYNFVAMGPTKTGFANDAGIAILSKYKIIQSNTFSYGQNCLGSACDSNQGIIHSRIQIDGVPHPIDVINTQFQSRQAAIAVNLANLLDYTQNKQLLDFAGYFVKNLLTDIPMIVGGDFESDVNSRIYQQLLYALKVRNGGKECADVLSCAVLSGSQRYELWFNSFDHQLIRNSAKILMKPLQGQRAFKTSDLAALISNGGALEMVYQLSWKP